MTMIAFATHGDHAEFITDTTSYTANGSAMGHCTKHVTLPHLDAAIITQGGVSFGVHAKINLLEASADVDTFDDLTALTQRLLQAVWGALGTSGEGLVILLGYSPSAGRFTAHTFSSDDGFTHNRVTQPWAIPMPWTARPTDIEVDRHRKRPGRRNLEEDLGAIAAWTAKPPLPEHRGIDEWRHLAETIREQRALIEYGRVFVAGSVLHTRLERGQITTAKIHEFNDQGEEFLRMIEWTFHPIAQLMECHCGSGERFRDCHLAEFHDKPCTCGKAGQTFAECCMVGAA